MEFKVALLQHSIWEGGFEKNKEKIEQILSGVNKKKFDFLLFPELPLRGFPYSKLDKNAYPLDESPDLNYFKELSQRFSCYCIGGIIEKEKNDIYNTTVIISPDGELKGYYRKIHLFEYEARYFSSGDSLLVLEIEGIKIGIATCYDLRFPELFRVLSLKGAQLIFVPGQFPSPRTHHWEILLRARAIENQIFVVGVNRCGESKILKYEGKSALISPFGDEVVSLKESEGMIIGKVEIDLIKKTRKKGSYLSDIKAFLVEEFFKICQ